VPLEVLTQVEVSELAEPGKRRQVAANTETARPPKVEVSELCQRREGSDVAPRAPVPACAYVVGEMLTKRGAKILA